MVQCYDFCNTVSSSVQGSLSSERFDSRDQKYFIQPPLKRLQSSFYQSLLNNCQYSKLYNDKGCESTSSAWESIKDAFSRFPSLVNTSPRPTRSNFKFYVAVCNGEVEIVRMMQALYPDVSATVLISRSSSSRRGAERPVAKSGLGACLLRIYPLDDRHGRDLERVSEIAKMIIPFSCLSDRMVGGEGDHPSTPLLWAKEVLEMEGRLKTSPGITRSYRHCNFLKRTFPMAVELAELIQATEHSRIDATDTA